MFKIPDWDIDTPNLEINLNQPKKKNKLNKSSGPKENGIEKTNFKTSKGNTNIIKKSNINVSHVQAHVENNPGNINKKKIKLVKPKPKPQKDANYVNSKTDVNINITHKVNEDKLNDLPIEKKRQVNKKHSKETEHTGKGTTNKILNVRQSDKINKNRARRLKTNLKKKLKATLNKQEDLNTTNSSSSVDDKNSTPTLPKTQKEKLNQNSSISKTIKETESKKDSDFDEEVSELNINKIKASIKDESENKDTFDMSADSIDSDKLDELILMTQKEKLKKYDNDNIEEMLFSEVSNERKRTLSSNESNDPHLKQTKKTMKEKSHKELLKSILQKETHRNLINSAASSTLRARMLEKLKAAKFRYLNEKLYTSSGSEAQEIFKSDPSAFQTYHEGYQQQVKKWPVRPLDVIVKRIQKMPKTFKIADMGCGEAELSQRVPHVVRSFDLVSACPRVQACDISRTPLLAAEMDAAVYCLALMGTNLTQYLLEANRVLKMGGHLLIAEVESRFNNLDDFTRDVQKLGFSLKKLDKAHKVFFFMEFTKVRDPPAKKAKLPLLTLKPCIYKKR